ncbi:MAG: hypothetical protein JNM19_03520 [Chitinophagaceae bacterium]|nr:hypothetical protein [Chitinophagaceae bacterium]
MVRIFYRYSLYYWILFIVLFTLFIRLNSIKEYRYADIRKAVIIDKLFGVTKGGPIYGSEYYYPQFQFAYQDTLYINADASFDFRGFAIGDTIRIYFPKETPAQSRIYTFETFWLRRIELFYFLVCGFLFFAFPKIAQVFYNDFLKKQK